jgi:hypothetical protein
VVILIHKIKVILLLFVSLMGLFAFAAERSESELKAPKNFPCGFDEQDLVVQEKLASPKATTDRQSIEQKVLKSNFKKNDGEKPNDGKPQ